MEFVEARRSPNRLDRPTDPLRIREASSNLTSAAISALEHLGATKIRGVARGAM